MITKVSSIICFLLFCTQTSQSFPVLETNITGGLLQRGSNPQKTVDNVAVNLHLSIGISSLARVIENRKEERQLEISWWSIEEGYLDGDQIILYRYESEALFCQAQGSVVVETVTIDALMANDSWTRLSSSMPYFEVSDLADNSCLYFWAAYARRTGEIVACNCLRARPHWMSDLQDRIQGSLLREIFLPGTHDSAAYEHYEGDVSDNLATKYAITQNEDLFSQLSFGVRYLDMRIIFRPGNEHRFWTHHGSYLLRPLINDTALVREFMNKTNEIVIFDIHGLSNMEAEPDILSTHNELQSLLIQEFGDYMAPQNLTWEATLGDFWASGKRLVVTYEQLPGTNNPLLWSNVKHQWGNVQRLEDLEIYLENVMAEAADDKLLFAWSSMVELTPTSQDVVTDRFNGLRNAADIVNRNVSIWFRDRWSSLATIVAHDFFLGSYTVDIALAENMRRFPSGNNTVISRD